MLSRATLEDVLKKFPGADSVSVVGESAFVATVVAEQFAGKDESERQEQVWNYLFENLEMEDTRQISFIFTNEPSKKRRKAA